LAFVVDFCGVAALRGPSVRGPDDAGNLGKFFGSFFKKELLSFLPFATAASDARGMHNRMKSRR
jgi:hypothetical protein